MRHLACCIAMAVLDRLALASTYDCRQVGLSQHARPDPGTAQAAGPVPTGAARPCKTTIRPVRPIRPIRSGRPSRPRWLGQAARRLSLALLVAHAGAHAQTAAQGQPTLDDRVVTLGADVKKQGLTMDLARRGHDILRDIEKSSLSPTQKLRQYQKTLDLMVALPSTRDDSERRDLLLREKHNAAMYLLGTPLDEIPDAADRAQLRASVAESLVALVAQIKSERRTDFKPTPVQLNLPLDGRDSDAERAQKVREFQAQGNRINDDNRYQMALAAELNFLRPKVAEYLRNNHGTSSDDQARLKLLLERL